MEPFNLTLKKNIESLKEFNDQLESYLHKKDIFTLS